MTIVSKEKLRKIVQVLISYFSKRLFWNNMTVPIWATKRYAYSIPRIASAKVNNWGEAYNEAKDVLWNLIGSSTYARFHLIILEGFKQDGLHSVFLYVG